MLIVDDDPTIRSLVRQTLDDEGYDTVVAGNGADALHFVETNRPACVLLDLHLPVLDGYGFLWVDHIPKPFDLDHLSTAVAMVTQVPPPDRPALGSDAFAAGT